LDAAPPLLLLLLLLLLLHPPALDLPARQPLPAVISLALLLR